jgi:MoaA/NifB/PqqE/SkfB family radical SAM enzyme
MTITHEHAVGDKTDGPLGAIWFEITGKCQLSCIHCYAGSGPSGDHGAMILSEWERVIRQAAGLGTRRVIFIGGEPTLHPDLPRLVQAALALGMHAETYTNLVHITSELWELFELPGVSLATSWYTDDRAQHEAITRRDTWRQTRSNIAEAERRGIPIRAGVVDGIVPSQRTAKGERELRALGITSIGTDILRKFGRGTIPDPSQACGRCGHGVAAVLPDGTVTPCPLTRWLSAGNVRDADLAALLEPLAAVTDELPVRGACNPNCVPDSYCNPLCTPGACKPRI